MRIETKYRCSFCDERFLTKDECEEHETVHPCYHCKNLVMWTKSKDGSLDCSCDVGYFYRSYGSCRYYTEGEPDKEYYVEEEDETGL